MPKFKKSLEELETRFEKWMYVLTQLPWLDKMPDKLKDNIFVKLFNQAERAAFSPEEQADYDESLKIYRDNLNTMNFAKRTAREEGLAEGYADGEAKGLAEGEVKGRKIIAKTLLSKGMLIEEVCQITDLSLDEVQKLY